MNSRRITRITAENFMRLKTVDISPAGDVIYITGANGEGKSSVLNAICAALNWRETAGSIPEPIHKGEKKAVVTIDLGDMIVTRTWTPSGSQLKVETIAGAKFPTPQAMLDEFFSRIGFDPLEFIRMQPKDQRQTLMELLGIDFSEFDRERAELLQQKSQVSASVTSLQSQLKEIPPVSEEVSDQEISAGDLLNQIQEAQQYNQHLKSVESEYNSLYQLCLKTRDDADKIRSQLAALEEQLDELWSKESNHQWNDLKTEPLKDIAPLQEQLKNIEETNRLVRQKQQAISVNERLQQAETKVSEITEAIKDIDQDKKDALQAAKFPITGLSFDESGVLFQGVPLKQASSAEQIRVSLAIGIAMNPSLKFLIIRDGSLLDSRSKGLIADMAAEHGMQVFIEAVDESGKIGFTIEDGMVRAPVEVQQVEPGQQVLA